MSCPGERRNWSPWPRYWPWNLKILLLDEPSNGLDDNTKARLMEALSQLDLSFILISHEIDFLSETADSICEMRDGKILLDEEVYTHPHYHRHPHGTVPHEHKP
jgi:cobalt/nickel transport system ATP-binding protein